MSHRILSVSYVSLCTCVCACMLACVHVCVHACVHVCVFISKSFIPPPGISRCQSCGCNAAGAEDGTVCNALTGECSCKRYVTGTVCDTCIAGFQQLEANNPFGCSAG